MKRRIKLSEQAALVEAQRILEIAKGYAPKKTGELADSGHVSKIIDKGEGAWRIELIFDALHAAAFERGSGIHAEERAQVSAKPYIILPTHSSILAFPWPNAPEAIRARASKFPLVFLTRIEHPGVRGTSYLRRALRENSQRLWSQIVETLAKG